MSFDTLVLDAQFSGEQRRPGSMPELAVLLRYQQPKEKLLWLTNPSSELDKFRSDKQLLNISRTNIKKEAIKPQGTTHTFSDKCMMRHQTPVLISSLGSGSDPLSAKVKIHRVKSLGASTSFTEQNILA